MKKKLSLILCVILAAGCLFGCNLFPHNYQRDYERVIVTISSSNDPVEVTNYVYGEDGELVYENSVVKTETVSYAYTSPEIKIYKSQLVNYVNYYLGDYLNNGMTLEDGVDKILSDMIDNELYLIEADRLFYAGVLYWTEEEASDIMHAVYEVIDDEILTKKNEILEGRNKPLLSAIEQGTESGETTYPVKPADEEDQEKAKFYKSQPDELSYQWYDGWYTDASENSWYIEDVSKYLSSYPGMFGTDDEKSLAREAFNAYLDSCFVNAENIIGVTAEQRAAVDADIEMLKTVRKTQGVEYVYPLLGKTTLIKLLVGNTYLKSKKLEKHQSYITNQVSFSYSEVYDEWQRRLKDQRDKVFVNLSNYNSAVDNDELILYTPSDRYLFVKHILLPFSEAQTKQLESIQTQEGIDPKDADRAKKPNWNKYVERRAALAEQIIVYEHINGEDDLAHPKAVKNVFNEIKAEMGRYKNNAKYAERGFDDLMYKYNTDPGIFDKTFGYPVVYELGKDESETYMPEFADGAREFRKNKKYTVGDILDYYVVTDYGIHVMYYAADPKVFETKTLNSYTTAGQYQTVYEYIEDAMKTESQSKVYETWKYEYLKANEDRNVINDKIIAAYKKELRKVVYG